MRSKRTGMDDPALRKAPQPSQIKAPMGQGQFCPHHLQTPLLIFISSYAFTRFREMSPLYRHSTIFLPSKSTEEPNSESFWFDGAISSALHEGTFCLPEGAAMPLEGPPVPPTVHLLPLSGDDHLGPPSGDPERVNFAGFTPYAWAMPFGNQPDDLYATFSLSLSLSTMTADYTFIPHRIAFSIHIREPTSIFSRMNSELVTQRRRCQFLHQHQLRAMIPSPPSPRPSLLPTCPPCQSTPRP